MTLYADPARPRGPRGGSEPRPSRPPSKSRPSKSRPPKKRSKQRRFWAWVPRRKDPIWAKLCAITGVLVMVIAGAAEVVPRVLANWATANIPKADLIPEGLKGNDISGPINFLLLGMDERSSTSKDLIRADTIIILHVPASHDSAYLVSLPRDAEVHIPAYPETGYRGGLDKINAAFAFGAMNRQEQGDDSTAGRQRGAALTMEAINGLVPGGMTFNGAAIISFVGFKDVVKAIGGVDLCVDVETRSIHYDNKGVYHTLEVPYDQRKIYKVGCQHMDYVSALDYARQRHFDTGDYVRQRHQQQLLMAIFKKLVSKGTLTDPGKVAQLQASAGKLLTVDLGGNSVLDWLFTLKGIDPKHLVMIKTNGGKITPGTIKGNEAFSPDSMQMLKAVRTDTLAAFLAQHPDWVTADQPVQLK